MTRHDYQKQIAAYVGHCLRHDITGGFAFLKNTPNQTTLLKRYLKRLESRLFLSVPRLRFKTAIPWVRKLLKAFAGYYVEVLVKKTPIAQAEEVLVARIESEILHHPLNADSTEEKLKAIDIELSKRFSEIGWFYLGGRTAPFLGPYIYEEQTVKNFSVDLPLGRRDLKVVFMKKFHSRSWLDFVTLGKSGTGGWAKTDGLYCVEDVYDLESNRFKVNYLQHEAQHFDDYERFPVLKDGHQAILEYRAKLVELIYSETIATFRYFMDEAVGNPQNPHAYASWLIKKALEEKLQIHSDMEFNEFDDLSALQEAAGAVYDESTASLMKNS